MTGTGSNGDYLILSGISPLLHTQVLVKPLQEVRVTSEIAGANSSAKGKALLIHAVSKSPQGSRAQLRKVAPHHTSEKEVNEGNVTLGPVPPELWISGLLLWRSRLVSILDVLRKCCSCRWLSVTSNSVRAVGSSAQKFSVTSFWRKKPAIHVEAEEAIEHVHAVDIRMVTEEVAAWVGSKNAWRANFLTRGRHVVCC